MKKYSYILFLSLFFCPYSYAIYYMEISGMASYSKTNISENSFSKTRRYVGAASVYLTTITQLELSYTDSKTYISNEPYQTSEILEKTLGLSIIQSLVPSTWPVQPYLKAGGAQYNRKQSGTVNGINTRPSETKSPSAILGGGLRIFLMKNFSLKGEAIAILPNLRIREAQDNFSIQAGVGWHF